MSYPTESDGSLNDDFVHFGIDKFPPTPIGYIPVCISHLNADFGNLFIRSLYIWDY